MPGYELINFKEKRAIDKLFKNPINIIDKDKISTFELKIKNWTKTKYCQVVTSGTAATKIALKAVGVKVGMKLSPKRLTSLLQLRRYMN